MADWRRALEGDWTGAGVRPALRALLAYAERLTREPARVGPSDLEDLRRAGWDDEAILHACEIVSYYNFVNRIAEGLGVALEPGWPHRLIPAPE